MKLGKYEKGIIITGVAVLIIFLILLTADGIKNIGKNKQNLALSEQEEVVPPNVPVLSAGMIPVKYEGDNLIICKNDSSWYNYEAGTPAYMMLNDGVYQSELIVDMVEKGKKLASDSLGQVVPKEEQGSIYMWIPRFEINGEDKIKYVRDVNYASEGYEIPEMFTHKQAIETSPDYLLTGIWVEKIPLASTSVVNTKVANMTGENNTYGFIANTVGVAMTEEDKTIIGRAMLAPTEEENQRGTVGAQAMHNEAVTRDARTATIICARMDDPSNPNRTIIHIINPQYRDVIKAKASYSKSTGIITVQVTYSEYGIDKIMLEEEDLIVEKDNKKATANTQGMNLEDGIYTITIIDTKGNKKKLKTQALAGIYATLYEDGTLAFGKNNPPIPETEKTVSVNYGDISDLTNANYISNGTPWKDEITNITSVDFVKSIMPKSTYKWFEGCSNLTEITFGENWKGAVKLPIFEKTYSGWYDKSNDNLVAGKNATYTPTGLITIYADITQPIYVKQYTDGTLAFNSNNATMSGKTVQKDYGDISEETSWTPTYASEVEKVVFLDKISPTSTDSWFYRCKNLTKIENIENLNTSKVTNMSYMFDGCSSLSSLDLSGFDTKNVTSMIFTFGECSSLTSLDLSSFDTSKVTSMTSIFYECSNLAEITFGENWKGAVKLPTFDRTYSGWYDNNNGNLVASKNATYTPTGAITIYADLTLPIYAKLYTDGTLAFSSNNATMSGKTVQKDYGDISEGWNRSYLSSIEKVIFLDRITPISTEGWFDSCKNLTVIENIENLNTSRVTSMAYMFYECNKLSSLDLSNFDTKNVTTMHGMFEGCSSLTSLDLSSFDTNKVTSMAYMFFECENLTTIYVGENWKLASSKGNMFSYCGTNTTTRK